MYRTVQTCHQSVLSVSTIVKRNRLPKVPFGMTWGRCRHVSSSQVISLVNFFARRKQEADFPASMLYLLTTSWLCRAVRQRYHISASFPSITRFFISASSSPCNKVASLVR